MTDPIKRALRTFLQAFLAFLLGSGILSTIQEEAVVDWSTLKKVGISAAAAGMAALVSWLMNFLEDSKTIPEAINKH